jgi:hypothetical protein
MLEATSYGLIALGVILVAASVLFGLRRELACRRIALPVWLTREMSISFELPEPWQ